MIDPVLNQDAQERSKNQDQATKGVSWTFLSNSAHVLICVARDSRVRMADIASVVGISERAVQKIMAQLVEAGVISRERVGRRNAYRIHRTSRLRHPIEADRSVASLLAAVLQPSELEKVAWSAETRTLAEPPAGR